MLYYCSRCDHPHENPTGSCAKCHYKMTCTCPTCAGRTPLNSQFCGLCGHRLERSLLEKYPLGQKFFNLLARRWKFLGAVLIFATGHWAYLGSHGPIARGHTAVSHLKKAVEMEIIPAGKSTSSPVTRMEFAGILKRGLDLLEVALDPNEKDPILEPLLELQSKEGGKKGFNSPLTRDTTVRLLREILPFLIQKMGVHGAPDTFRPEFQDIPPSSDLVGALETISPLRIFQEDCPNLHPTKTVTLEEAGIATLKMVEYVQYRMARDRAHQRQLLKKFFIDLPWDHPIYRDIHLLTQYHYFAPYEDQWSFRGDEWLSRTELAHMVTFLAENYLRHPLPQKGNPLDLGKVSPQLRDKIGQSIGMGILTVDGKNQFKPMETVTRGDLVTALYYGLGFMDREQQLALAVEFPDAKPVFKDVREGTPLAEALEYFAQFSIPVGYGKNEFRPSEKVDRAESLKILAWLSNRLLTGANYQFPEKSRLSESPSPITDLIATLEGKLQKIRENRKDTPLLAAVENKNLKTPPPTVAQAEGRQNLDQLFSRLQEKLMLVREIRTGGNHYAQAPRIEDLLATKNPAADIPPSVETEL